MFIAKSLRLLALATALVGNGPALTVSAQSNSSNLIRVSVGMGGLFFVPNNIFARKGDTVEFDFYPMNHSVVEGDFAKPCSPAADAFFSGYIPSKAGAATKTFSVVINDTDPIYIYCSQAKHCQAGMVAVINPSTNFSDSLSAYMAGAKNATANVVPSYPGPFGGVITDSGTNSSAGTTNPNQNGTSNGTGVATTSGVAGPSGTNSPSGSATGSGAGASGATSSSSTALAAHLLNNPRTGELAGFAGLIVGILGYLV